MNYPDYSKWKEWMKSYKYGTLVFIPTGKVFNNIDLLRKEYDPESAKFSMPHMTLTQPFSKAPTESDIEKIKDIVEKYNSFEIITGPATTSPNERLIWVDVNPKKSFVELREKLHSLDLFRTDLPFTKGFVPHMTISEFGKTDNEVKEVVALINEKYDFQSHQKLKVKWIIPDDNFVFTERYSI